MPQIRYPHALPVSRRKDEIAAAIRDHQVVIVAGETGSGKTTQLPKICLELGRGDRARATAGAQPGRSGPFTWQVRGLRNELVVARTLYPVSDKRIYQAMDELAG